ncbi:hypothetical protein A2U01_0058846, partial [Trifolium medium]|nr:hypothetical protein [Trifolium medium]
PANAGAPPPTAALLTGAPPTTTVCRRFRHRPPQYRCRNSAVVHCCSGG